MPRPPFGVKVDVLKPAKGGYTVDGQEPAPVGMDETPEVLDELPIPTGAKRSYSSVFAILSLKCVALLRCSLLRCWLCAAALLRGATEQRDKAVLRDTLASALGWDIGNMDLFFVWRVLN